MENYTDLLHIELIPPIKGDWSDKAIVSSTCPDCKQIFSREEFVNGIIPYCEIQKKCNLCYSDTDDKVVIISSKEWDK